MLDNYEFNAVRRMDFKKIEALEARELKVNGKIPLEKWLPYETMCGDKEPVDPIGSSLNLDWDKKRHSPER